MLATASPPSCSCMFIAALSVFFLIRPCKEEKEQGLLPWLPYLNQLQLSAADSSPKQQAAGLPEAAFVCHTSCCGFNDRKRLVFETFRRMFLLPLQPSRAPVRLTA